MKLIHPSLWLLLAGGLFGVLSWALAWAVSGHFEPYDSGSGLLLNQLLLGVPLALLLPRFRLTWLWFYLLGAWLGMNAWSYLAGSSESRAWAQAGAVVSLLLLALPALGLSLVGVWRRLRPR